MSDAEPLLTFPTLRMLRRMLEVGGEVAGADLTSALGIASGTVAPTLRRLADAGWLAERWEQGDAAELGRPLRHLYRLTEKGASSTRAAFNQLIPAHEDPHRDHTGPLRETHRIPALHGSSPIGSFTLRLYWSLWDDGRVGWVDFDLFEVVSHDSDDATRLYYDGGAGSTGVDLEAAAPGVSGFVKWDGCTQFQIDDGVHVDSRAELDNLFNAIGEARRLCAAAMPWGDITEDYKGKA